MSITGERADVSAYVICRNEAENIVPCLQSVAWCREIIVVDSGSTDDTLELVRQLQERGEPIRLFEREWPGYAKQKQFALDQCTSEWVLNLDSDERIEEALAGAIIEALPSEGSDGYRLPLCEWLHGYGYPPRWVSRQKLLRLVRRRVARYDTTVLLHEGLTRPAACRDITAGCIRHRHRAVPADEIEKQNRYTTLKVEQRIAAGKKAKPWRMLTAPIAYFLKIYLLKRYALCGWAGAATAAFAAQYAFQTEWKHWSHDAEGARQSDR